MINDIAGLCQWILWICLLRRRRPLSQRSRARVHGTVPTCSQAIWRIKHGWTLPSGCFQPANTVKVFTRRRRRKNVEIRLKIFCFTFVVYRKDQNQYLYVASKRRLKCSPAVRISWRWLSSFGGGTILLGIGERSTESCGCTKNGIEYRSKWLCSGKKVTRCKVDLKSPFVQNSIASPTLTKIEFSMIGAEIHSVRLACTSKPGTSFCNSKVMLP